MSRGYKKITAATHCSLRRTIFRIQRETKGGRLAVGASQPFSYLSKGSCAAGKAML
jgi:hypothetical protein